MLKLKYIFTILYVTMYVVCAHVLFFVPYVSRVYKCAQKSKDYQVHRNRNTICTEHNARISPVILWSKIITKYTHMCGYACIGVKSLFENISLVARKRKHIVVKSIRPFVLLKKSHKSALLAALLPSNAPPGNRVLIWPLGTTCATGALRISH